MGRPFTPADRFALYQANLAWHFKKRVRQRFGLELSDDDLADIVWRIQQDKPGVIFLATREDGRSAWRVKWRNVTMVVIFDHRAERLVTAYSYKKWKWE